MTRRTWAAAVLAGAAAGCSETPRAPDLTTEAVYQYDPAGLRFPTPDGWAVYSRAIPPEGRLTRPVRLVAYFRAEGPKRADLELYAIDPAEGQDLLAYLAEHPIGPDRWAPKPPETLSVNGVEATRHLLSASGPRADMRREVTAFRRDGGRVYAFVLTHEASDTKHREQARRAIEKVTWK